VRGCYDVSCHHNISLRRVRKVPGDHILFWLITSFQVYWIAHTYEDFEEFEEFGRVFLPGNKAPAPGDIFANVLAANTLEEIARTAGESFYRGDLARAISQDAARCGGSLSSDDLAVHRSQWVEPISQCYHGRELFEIPPNGQGLAALIAIGILNQFDIAQYPLDSADCIHLQVEAMKLGFADVFRHLADIDSMRVSPETFLDSNYLAKRASTIKMDRALFPDTGIPDAAGTVYLAAADSSGMMVSFIQSNFHGFGSGIVIPDTGISLNNRGYGFTLEKLHPNCVGGGKKPFHTIIPGFVMERGAPLMSFGVMGGHMQAQGHVQMMTRICDYKQNPQAASDAPRWHITADSQLALESGFSPEVIYALQQRGHTVRAEEAGIFGGAQLILRSGECYCAGSDHRKDGQAVGF